MYTYNVFGKTLDRKLGCDKHHVRCFPPAPVSYHRRVYTYTPAQLVMVTSIAVARGSFASPVRAETPKPVGDLFFFGPTKLSAVFIAPGSNSTGAQGTSPYTGEVLLNRHHHCMTIKNSGLATVVVPRSPSSLSQSRSSSGISSGRSRAGGFPPMMTATRSALLVMMVVGRATGETLAAGGNHVCVVTTTGGVKVGACYNDNDEVIVRTPTIAVMSYRVDRPHVKRRNTRALYLLWIQHNKHVQLWCPRPRWADQPALLGFLRLEQARSQRKVRMPPLDVVSGLPACYSSVK